MELIILCPETGKQIATPEGCARWKLQQKETELDAHNRDYERWNALSDADRANEIRRDLFK